MFHLLFAGLGGEGLVLPGASLARAHFLDPVDRCSLEPSKAPPREFASEDDPAHAPESSPEGLARLCPLQRPGHVWSRLSDLFSAVARDRIPAASSPRGPFCHRNRALLLGMLCQGQPPTSASPPLNPLKALGVQNVIPPFFFFSNEETAAQKG